MFTQSVQKFVIRNMQMSFQNAFAVLTSWRVLQNITVIIRPSDHVQLSGCNRLADRVSGDDLDLSGIVLAGLRDVQMVHSIVGKLVAGALR